MMSNAAVAREPEIEVVVETLDEYVLITCGEELILVEKLPRQVSFVAPYSD